MNKYQHLVQQQFLNNEEAVIKRLNQVYNKAYDDITKKAKKLQDDITGIDLKISLTQDPDEIAKLKSMRQAKVYQKKYQESLKKQVGDILDTMHKESFKTVSDYLYKSYEDGFIGTLYDLQGQGIPLAFPLDQEAMVRAVQLDSKISNGLYSHLGEDVSLLKKRITAEISRGISTGATFQQIAKQLSLKMTGTYENPGGSLAYAMRIARTEGHRIQIQGTMDACYKAKSKGADVVKQWDSTLDGRTRESHQMVDGEIKELDEEFSNGLRFPGDPSGGAAEVVNCRCALLQRARWGLDEEELETLKERAEYFGLDKSESFEEYKNKHLQTVSAPEPVTPPKKEYLTKKKLEQNIKDGQIQLDDLHNQFLTATGHIEYDDIINDFGSLEDFAKGEQLKTLKALHQQSDDLKKQMEEWQEKLDKKLVSAETKKLKKEAILLQDELDAIDIKTYSGIWKDDVTTADWSKLNIDGKKKYYEGKFIIESDPIKMKEFQELYKQLQELDDEGKKYFEIQQKINKNKADLTKLQKSGKISQISQGNLDDFSQDRKDAAMWVSSTRDADARLRDVCGETWRNASSEERYAIYDYTVGSGKFNRPLSGFEKPYAEYGSGWEPKYYKGINKVWLDYEGAGDEIRNVTSLISKSTYDFDMWVQHGCGGSTMDSFLGLPSGTFEGMSQKELEQFIGFSGRRGSFMSCGVSKGQGFSHQPVICNVYAPKGTQMMYCEPFSHFGNGSKLHWDGQSSQSSFGYEAEILIQRGASFTITKVEKVGGKIYLDMEVHPEQGYDLFQQDDSEWMGSRKKGR
jgi:hypothetical protein